MRINGVTPDHDYAGENMTRRYAKQSIHIKAKFTSKNLIIASLNLKNKYSKSGKKAPKGLYPRT